MIVTEKVEPAVPPSVWDLRGFYGLFGYARLRADDNGRVGLEIGDKPGHTTYWFGTSAHDSQLLGLEAIIALANHALPDGHALKITRADVEAMERYADTIDGLVGQTFPNDPLRSTIAKLNALLPPAR